jgi:hypothetical protein
MQKKNIATEIVQAGANQVNSSQAGSAPACDSKTIKRRDPYPIFFFSRF